jgi:hypothetical protein
LLTIILRLSQSFFDASNIAEVAPNPWLLCGSALQVFVAYKISWPPRKISSSAQKISTYLLIALCFCWVGDVWFSQLIVTKTNSVVLGVLSYTLAHIISIYGMYMVLKRFKHFKKSTWIYVIWALGGLVIWRAFVFSAIEQSYLLISMTAIYTVLLAANAASATVLATIDRKKILLCLGMTMFFISDIFTGIAIFNPELWQKLYVVKHVDIISIIYGTAQVLIVLSMANGLSKPRQLSCA